MWAQNRFHPGNVVPEPYLKVFGCDSFFSISVIPDDIKQLMDGCSYKEMCSVGWEDLCYLQVLHRDANGNAIVGEMVCHKSIADDLLEIFRELYENNYPIERMLLVDHYGGDDEASMSDNNTSCFNQRTITTGGMLSKHSYGLAIDINPRYNPYYRKQSMSKTIVEPKESADFVDRDWDFPYKINKGDLCHRLFRKHGFHWGGDWTRYKDYQHFQK